MTFESALVRHERYALVAVAPVQPLVAWWLLCVATTPRRRRVPSSMLQGQSLTSGSGRRLLDSPASPLILGGAQWSRLHPSLLQQFLVVVEARGVDRAASRLMISPAALRKSMRRLERQLETRLFVPDTRVFQLTADGDALKVPAQRIVSAAARFKAGMRSIDGVLRVAHSADVDTLAIVLDRYAEHQPDVRAVEQVLGNTACEARPCKPLDHRTRQHCRPEAPMGQDAALRY